MNTIEWKRKTVGLTIRYDTDSPRGTSGAEAKSRVCEREVGVRTLALEALFTEQKTSEASELHSEKSEGLSRRLGIPRWALTASTRAETSGRRLEK